MHSIVYGSINLKICVQPFIDILKLPWTDQSRNPIFFFWHKLFCSMPSIYSGKCSNHSIRWRFYECNNLPFVICFQTSKYWVNLWGLNLNLPSSFLLYLYFGMTRSQSVLFDLCPILLLVFVFLILFVFVFVICILWWLDLNPPSLICVQVCSKCLCSLKPVSEPAVALSPRQKRFEIKTSCDSKCSGQVINSDIRQSRRQKGVLGF